MKLHSLKLQRITRYTNPVEINFDALGPGLIALAGVNGAGKTSLLEAPYAALYLEMPSRPGSVYDVASGRDANIDLSFSNGAPYRALVAVDTIGQKTEAYLFDGDGNPLAKGKVREFNAEILRRFGSSRLFLSACLSAQNKRGAFLDLSKVERKELLSEMLDTGGLQVIAEAARERAKQAEAELAVVRGRLSALVDEGQRVQAALHDARLTDLDAMEEALRTEEEVLGAALAVAHAMEGDAKAELARAEEATKGKLEAGLAVGDATKAVNLEQSRKRAAESSHGGRIQQMEGELAEAHQDAAALPRYLQAEEAAREHETRVAELREQEGPAAKTPDDARAVHVAAVAGEQKQKLITLQADNLRKKAALMGDVPCHGAGEFAACGFLKDALVAKIALPAMEAELGDYSPCNLEELASAVKSAKLRLEDIRSLIRTLEIQIKGDMMDVARIPAAKAAEHRAHTLMDRIADENSKHSVEIASIQEAIIEAQGRLTAAIEKLNSLASVDLGILAKAVKDAAGTIVALERRLQTVRAAMVDVQAKVAAKQANQARLEELDAAIGEAQGRVDALIGDAGEWGTLDRAFGRDGIQALEIDAAGPELSKLTNDLLTSCFGERFEIRFVTQVPKADGKGMKEVFDLQVIDHERGREGAVDSLSGGEKTIVSEAISLALAIYTGKHSEHRYETLFRDETAGALDPDNAHRYIAMLRKAREVGSFDQVIFIAQQPEVWQEADSVLWCADGKVEVRK